MTYLGYLLDSRQQRIFLPQEKVQKIDVMRLLQDNQPVSIRRGRASLGLLTLAITAVQWAGLHFHPLQTFILKVWNHSRSSLDALVSVPPHSKEVGLVVESDGKPVTGPAVGFSGYQSGDHGCKWQRMGAYLEPLMV